MSTPSNQEFCFQTLLYFENEIKDYLFYELDLENDKILVSFWVSMETQQNSEPVLSNFSNNHIIQPGRTYIEFFAFCYYFISNNADPLLLLL